MYKFREIPLTNNSISKIKPVYGFGVNDSKYKVTAKVDGKWVMCKIYRKWQGMLERCYSSKYHVKKPTYKDCVVCDEWLLFSNFKTWMEKQEWHDMELDKDLLGEGKLYSPENCIFIPQKINTLLQGGKSNKKSGLPAGVKASGSNYQARCSNGSGINIHIGNFKTKELASAAYTTFKKLRILNEAKKQPMQIRLAMENYVR